MSDYYDRLEVQLAQATLRGVPGRRSWVPRHASRLFAWRLRADLVVGAVAVAVAAAVALVFIGVGAERPRPTIRPPVTGHAPIERLPAIRNYAPGKPPALGGQLFCDATLSAPGGAASPTGYVIVNTRPPTQYVYSITASGLRPAPPGEVYEVWGLAETTTITGVYHLLNYEKPALLGVIKPSVGPDGKLALEGLLPVGFPAPAKLLITVQRLSTKTPGRTVVLEGNVPL